MSAIPTPERSVASLPDRHIQSEAFQSLPYGLMVVDHSGTAVCMNLQAARLLGSTGLQGDKLTCCALLGCDAQENALAPRCVTQRALRAQEALPEIRVEIHTAVGPTALWVLAAPLGDGSPRVVLQLRPGVAGDRRRRTDPHWMTQPRLNVLTLGTTKIESGGGDWLDQRTGQMLKYLIATRPRAVTIDEIAESIWRDASYTVSGSVRYYVHSLRRALEPGRANRAPATFILSRGGGYRLNLDRVHIDADEFESRIDTGLAALDGDRRTAAVEIEAGIALYRGDFLAELPFAEWAMAERARLHDMACTGLSTLVDIRLDEGSADQGVRWLEQLSTLQPYDQGVHERLIDLEIRLGRHTSAMRRYSALSSRINRAFGHEPSFTPAELAVRSC
jgi:DNA-binding SARP family transcriptional activator